MFIASFAPSEIRFNIPGTSGNNLLLPLWCLHATCHDMIFTAWIWRKVKFCGEVPWHLFAHDVWFVMGRDVRDGLCHQLWLPQSPGEAALSRAQGSVTFFWGCPNTIHKNCDVLLLQCFSCQIPAGQPWAAVHCGCYQTRSAPVSPGQHKGVFRKFLERWIHEGGRFALLRPQ